MASICESSLSRRTAPRAHCPSCYKPIGIWPIFVARFLNLSRFGRCLCPHCACCLEFENVHRLHRRYWVASWSIGAAVFAAPGISGFFYATSQTRLFGADSGLWLLLSAIALLGELLCLALPMEWVVASCLHEYHALTCIDLPKSRFVTSVEFHKKVLGLPLSLRIFAASQVICATVAVLLVATPIWRLQAQIWQVEHARGRVSATGTSLELTNWWGTAKRERKGIADVEVSLCHPGFTNESLGQISPTLREIDNLYSLKMRGTQITDEGLRHISGLSNLLWLEFECWTGSKSLVPCIDTGKFRITDAGLSHLRGLTSLKTLDLIDAAVTDSGLAHLENMSDLRHLSLHGTQVTGVGLKQIGKCKRLQSLELNGSTITDSGLIGIEHLTGLERLNLDDTQVTDAGLIHLRSLTKLKSLSLSGTRVTGAGLADLKHLPGLKTFTLDRAAVTDAGLESVSRFESLISLSLKQTRVTGAGISHLKNLTKLQTLDLESTSITDAGMEHLQDLTSLSSLNVKNTEITDASLQNLRGLQGLFGLHAENTQISDEGFAELSKFLPKLWVRHSRRR